MKREELTKSMTRSQLAQIDVEEPSQAGDFIEDFTAGVESAAIVEEVKVGAEGFKKGLIQKREARDRYKPETLVKNKNVQTQNLLGTISQYSSETAVENNTNFYNKIMSDIEGSINNTYIDTDGNLQTSPFQVTVVGTNGSSARDQGREYLKQIRKERTGQ